MKTKWSNHRIRKSNFPECPFFIFNIPVFIVVISVILLFVLLADSAGAASYHVRCINESGSFVRVWYSLDSLDYERFLDVDAAEEVVSESTDVVWGIHEFNARWQDPGTSEWSTMRLMEFIGIDEDQEFVVTLEDDDPGGDDDRDDRDDIGDDREDRDDDRDDDDERDDDDDRGDDDRGDDDDAPVDSDRDGVVDDEDAFPNDPEEIRDTDGDGIGDNADPDDDNDQMPDTWELEHGLDPSIDDAAGDPDDDGLTNLDEYEARTDPNQHDSNFPPAPPDPIYPEDEAETLALPVTLQISGFQDPDDDEHGATQWQISRSPVFSPPIFEGQSRTHLTSIEVPGMILQGESRYYWRARFMDDMGAESPWSDVFYFTTDTWSADADGNGMPDEYEFVDYSDMDENGINDLEQSDIRCIITAVDEDRYIGVKCPADSATIEALDVIRSESLGSAEDRPANMPYGMISFRLRVNEPGAAVRLWVYFSEPVSDAIGWYKYSPIAGWIDYSENAQFAEDGRSVEIELQDGGEGDIDGAANGWIVDPSGVGVGSAITDDDDDDDDGGQWHVTCFINTLFR